MGSIHRMRMPAKIWANMMGWIQNDILGVIRQVRWRYLPPLMVYFAAGVSGFTGIIESFFVKEYLGLNPAFLAGLGFWAGLPWALKMPLGHLVDLFWQRKFLSVYGALMTAPFIGMYYGLHEWTRTHLGFGARTIALIDTMADSPLGQVAMIPMLAWIAKEAPKNRKATYFAVMAAFTNLALSASHLGTKYLNAIYVVERGHYAELGVLMIVVVLLGLVLPTITVLLLKPSDYQIWKRGFRYVQHHGNFSRQTSRQ